MVPPRAESCADNPLGPGCPVAPPDEVPSPDDEANICELNPLISPCYGPGELPPEEEVDDEEPAPLLGLRTQAEYVLLSECGSCHGDPGVMGREGDGGLSQINDWDELIESGYVIPCSAQRSPLLQVMRSGRMPPPDTGVVSSTWSSRTVADAIELDCTPEQIYCANYPDSDRCL